MTTEETFMRMALEEAEEALEEGEVPVGAVAVFRDKVIGRGRNRRERLDDPTAHAEILALRAAAEYLRTWRLENIDLHVTLEPCTMCAGAIVQARVRRLFFGALDPKAGAVVSLYKIGSDDRLNHQVEVFRGILEEECEQLLKRFFASKR